MRYTVTIQLNISVYRKQLHIIYRYVVYRKRKVYVGEGNIKDLENVFKKFEKDKFMFPTSDLLMSVVPDFLNELNQTGGVQFCIGQFYDLSDLRDVYYDVLAFSPSGIESLFKNFPDFKQKNT